MKQSGILWRRSICESAMLYGVETKVLNQAVKRNRERFSNRFMFQLTEEELENLKSQIVTSNPSLEQTIKMGIRRTPYVFTEQGVAMLSAVLKSDAAIRVSIQIMDAFSAMRRALVSVTPILSRLDVVERRQIIDQQRNEERFDAVFKAMDGGDFPPPNPASTSPHPKPPLFLAESAAS